ncbi:hypothetical protein PGQ11_012088 [Apiospora arundinis]|uniref:Uncharacterized protein n=1 Tax=Apiospora arundinis TaxID=335852 RepID=A0ABR2I1I7_9PEZI
MSNETVGSLLAVIANSINDALRIMMFADKRAWGPDEFEQLRLLEDLLDEAKRDFQELPILVKGRFYYEHNRKPESLDDLRELCSQFELHTKSFKDWAKMGGPINPVWATETIGLRRELHRAQCRAARRIFNSEQETSQRCLGAFQVHRVQRTPENAQQRQLEELMMCNQVGKFERYGELDIAFICDFCDGYLVWEDVREMPTRRTTSTETTATTTAQDTPGGGGGGSSNNNNNNDDIGSGSVTGSVSATEPTSSTAMAPGAQDSWHAQGFKRTNGEEKAVVFAPVAIANHLPTEPGDFQARILCPYCEDYYEYEQGDGEMEAVKWNQDEKGFDDVQSFQEHLEWSHADKAPNASTCAVM